MKLLLDQGLPRSTASLLREAGIDSVHASEIGLANAEDAEILKRASRENEIVFTLDADFHSLLAVSGEAAPSVVRLRIEGLRAAELCQIIKNLLATYEEDLRLGAVVSVTETRVRLRRLPL